MHRDFTCDVFILVYPDGGYVALDAPSGGYPYKVTEWYRAEFWTDKGQMLRFKEMFTTNAQGEKMTYMQILPTFIPE
jgi:hypothetical protein